jgi:DNA-binding MurR/RpiR family transcriptional regulator
VTRFAVALGYEGYPALRRRLRELATNGSADGPATGNGAAADEDQLQQAVRTEADNLRRLAERLGGPAADRDGLAAAAALLAATRPLPVLGLRAAAPLAAYFAYFAAKVLPDVRILDTGGSMLADRLEQARGAGATAMLAFVLPRYPRESVEALRAARAAGLSVVTITDSALSPAAEHTDVTLAAAVGTRLVFDLHCAPMAMSMVLLQALCDAAPGDAQRRLEEFETSAARRNLFVS